MRVLKIKTRLNPKYYPNKIPKLPFVRNYPYSLMKVAEKFANLADLSEQISRLN